MSDRRPFLRDILPAIVLLLLGTIYFRFTDADVDWTRAWRGGPDWPLADAMPWRVLYNFGTYPALLAALAALILLVAGYRSARFARYRRQCVYLVSLLAVGPGILTNAILKDHWGRPRPRDVDALGGIHPYERILDIDPISPGKSFPCGHATMGFFFFAAYFLLRKSHPKWALASLVVTLIYGFLIGWARIVQGGHFPSDVLWAAALIWIVAAALARGLRVEQVSFVPADFKPVSWARLATVVGLVPIMAFLVLLATPIDENTTWKPADQSPVPIDLRIKLPLGNTTIGMENHATAGAPLSIQSRSKGFGLPGGGLKSVWKEQQDAKGTLDIEFKQRISGLQSELTQILDVNIPAETIQRLHITQETGALRLKLPSVPRSSGASRRWILELNRGHVVIEPAGHAWSLKHGDKTIREDAQATDEVQLLLGPDVDWKISEKSP